MLRAQRARFATLALLAAALSASAASAQALPAAGQGWRIVATRHFGAASARSPRDIWALGDCGGPCFDVLHYNGTAWRRVTSPALKGVQFAGILAQSPAEVWASGTVMTPSREVPWLVHRNGTAWTRVKLPWPVILGGLAPDGRGGIWLIATGQPGGRSWAAHLSRAGRWQRYLLSASSFAVSSLALIPGGSSLWGAGAVPTRTGANTAIWAY